MSPFRLAAVARFAIPLAASAQPFGDRPEPLFQSVPKLRDGAVKRILAR